MTMKPKRTSVALALTMCLTATLVAASGGAASAASSSETTGVTQKTIRVGQVDTLSGPVPGLFAGAQYGTLAYFRMVNSSGGVNGRKIQLDVKDDAFSAANYASETQQLTQQDFALVGGFSLFEDSGVPAINAVKIPDVTLAASEQRSLDQFNYSPDPVIWGGSRLGPLVYFKKKYGSAIKHVGTLVGNVAAAEQESDAVYSAMKSLGYKIVYERSNNPLDTDFTDDVLKMKQAGVQIVYLVGEQVTAVANLAKEMQQQNFHPKLFATNGESYDSSYIPEAGTAAANGSSVDMQSALYLGQDAKSVPAVKTFDTWMKKVNPKQAINVYAVYGWTCAQLFVQALKNAGTNPTRTSLFASLNKITSFNASGLLATANPAQKRPPTCWILAQVKNGNWQRVPPSPTAGFTCNPGGYYYPPGYKPFVRQPPPSG
jgi:branched-chain amino acid transport system substrate-binding protein